MFCSNPKFLSLSLVGSPLLVPPWFSPSFEMSRTDLFQATIVKRELSSILLGISKRFYAKVGIETYEQKEEKHTDKGVGKKRKSVKRLQSKGKMICRVGKVKAEIRKKKRNFITI